MEKILVNENLKIENEWLYLTNGDALKLSEITNINILWYPKRKWIKVGAIWCLLVYLYDKFYIDTNVTFLIGLLLVFGVPIWIWDSIKYNRNDSITALQIQVSSGFQLHIGSPNRLFLDDLYTRLCQAIQTQKVVHTFQNYGTINIAKTIHNENRQLYISQVIFSKFYEKV